MKRILLAVVASGGIVFGLYVGQGGNQAQVAAFLADAGISPTHQFTCTVRIDGDTRGDAIAGNPNIKGYETLTFPVSIKPLPDGGQERTMPPMRKADSLLVDWDSCTSATCTPAVCNKWGSATPFKLENKTGRCFRKNVAANKQNCALPDGGDPGDMNVYPAAWFKNTAQCDAVEGFGPACSVILGDNPNTDM